MADRDPNIWSAERAKARFSELMRRAQADGPQTVTVHGRPTVRVVAASDVPAPDRRTGLDMLRAFQNSPLADVPDEYFEREKYYPRIRDLPRFDDE